MQGVVRDLRATVNVTLHLVDQTRIAIEFEVDTAFKGALAIPPDAVAALGLLFRTETRTMPASGIPFQANVHKAVIEWDSEIFVVNVLAMGLRPLIGTALLDDHDLHIEYTEGGK